MTRNDRAESPKKARWTGLLSRKHPAKIVDMKRAKILNMEWLLKERQNIVFRSCRKNFATTNSVWLTKNSWNMLEAVKGFADLNLLKTTQPQLGIAWELAFPRFVYTTRKYNGAKSWQFVTSVDEILSYMFFFWKQKLRLQYLLIKMIEVAKTTFQQTNKIQ